MQRSISAQHVDPVDVLHREVVTLARACDLDDLRDVLAVEHRDHARLLERDLALDPPGPRHREPPMWSPGPIGAYERMQRL